MCDCFNWADCRPLWVKHHRDCPEYDPIRDATDLITRLVHGMDAWAHDCDGVHEAAWEAYEQAKMSIGEKVDRRIV